MTNFNYDLWSDLGEDVEIGLGEFYETIIEFTYRKILQQGDVALDGGANRGRHTIPMAKAVKPPGRVIGFEPIPSLASDLSRTLAAEGLSSVEIVNKALGAASGSADFTHVEEVDYYSGLKRGENIPEGAQSSIKTIKVEITTLDTALEQRNLNRARFIKLDLEGGEYDALVGARDIMDRMKPFIIFENGRSSSARVYGYDKADWFELFYSRGYRLFDLFGRPFTPADWENAGVPWYFVAVKRASDKAFVHCELPAMVNTIANFYALKLSLK